MRKIAGLAAAAALLAAGPALAMGPPTKHCSASIGSGGQSVFVEVTREGDKPTQGTMNFRLPLAGATAPGGRLLEGDALTAALPYGAVNGEMAIRLMRTKDMTGYFATLTVGEGWSIADVRLTLPVADLGKADRISNLRVQVGGETVWFGFVPRLGLDDAVAASVVRPGLTGAGIGPDSTALFKALRGAPEAELQAVDKTGKVLVSARFRSDRVEALFERGRESADLLDMAAGMTGPCDADDVDLDS